jgi:hypothetical protein
LGPLPGFSATSWTAEVKNGIFYALLPGITISLIGIAFFAMDSLNILDPETKSMLNAVQNKGPQSPPFRSPYG